MGDEDGEEAMNASTRKLQYLFSLAVCFLLVMTVILCTTIAQIFTLLNKMETSLSNLEASINKLVNSTNHLDRSKLDRILSSSRNYAYEHDVQYYSINMKAVTDTCPADTIRNVYIYHHRNAGSSALLLDDYKDNNSVRI